MKTNKPVNPLLERLRYHVTGAIERGEAQAIVGIPSSESLEPLVAPVGVTGTTLPASPEGVACVPAEKWFTVRYKVGNSGPFSCPVLGRDESDAVSRFEAVNFESEREFLSVKPRENPPAPDKLPFEPIDASKVDFSPSPAEPVKVPASPVKDTPAKGLDIPLRHCACGTPFDATGTCPACYSDDDLYVRPELDALEDAPASPVDSVGVPARLQAVLEKANETLPGKRVACQSDFRKDIQTALTRALASHAAKDARIADLEQALKTVLDLARDTPTDALVRFAYIRSRCRAALALPSA